MKVTNLEEVNKEHEIEKDTQNEAEVKQDQLVDKRINNMEEGAPSPKRGKYEQQKNKKRGQNKNRPVFKETREKQLCRSLLHGPNEKPCEWKNCQFSHDLKDYLAKKGADIDAVCPVFANTGYCPRGVTCRYAQAHLDAEGCNIKESGYDENNVKESTFNGINSELQMNLRKHLYDFEKSKLLVNEVTKNYEEKKKETQNANAECSIEHDDATKSESTINKRCGAVVDEYESRKPLVDFKNKLVLSPLTTVGNLPFRRICKEYGADITCGEMACAVPLVKGAGQEWALTKRHESEDIFGVQLCGNNPKLIAQAAQVIVDNAKVDFIDLNIGCPIDLIYQQGGGSALMRRTNILELAVRSCSKLIDPIPFTVKMRTGVYADKNAAHKLVPLVEEWGAAAVTIHGRSREQRYTKSANWEYIEECASMATNIPIIGNGDILNYEDYNQRRQSASHVSSIMIGRGALIKPWIFKEIKEEKHLDPTASERFDMLRKYVNYGLEHWGSDTKGVETTRRFLLEWQSFLYRYVPYGLLISPPQTMNQRAEAREARNELELLLGSPNSKDWVRLSEMLLGPVPEGYQFVPKHKANAY